MTKQKISEKEVLEFITSCDSVHLKQVDDLVTERWFDLTHKHETTNFSLGDKVMFSSKHKGVITGKVTKVNRVTVKFKATKKDKAGNYPVLAVLPERLVHIQ